MKNIVQLMIALFFVVMLSACSTKMGATGEKSHFAFPNSNVVPLGKVAVEKSRWGFIIPPTIDADDIKEAINEALAQKPGADILINYKTDVKYTTVFPQLYHLTYTLEGTAADMQVGEQELLENVKY